MKIYGSAMILLLIGASCASDPGSSGSNGGNGVGANGGNGQGAGPSVPDGDAFPAGAVSFFYRLACPFEWSEYADGAGRVIVGANEGLPSGTLMGKPLSNGENRTHTHTLSADVMLASAQISAPEMGNNVLTAPMTYSFAGTTDAIAADVPYRQLLVCKKMENPRADVLPLPAKLHTYFDLDVCPSGWKSATSTAGRILIGLPGQAPADTPWGGAPMTSPAPRTHTHVFASTLVVPPNSVTAFDGFGGIFGKVGSYPIEGETDPAAIDVPMVALLHCEKE